ncbi:hypothetical protein A9404_06090 [Halothiobacillus diazotrophicus]|uniref:OmpA-like domain-containing protein n=2 Tax=Halothiobacillus diazotrophicus TaxID=1860122 RepID=A0A191ZGJ6_9GAMM|nr:hypothetical protein A9404_06090 [Halothiobacillus diazotrophicus]
MVVAVHDLGRVMLLIVSLLVFGNVLASDVSGCADNPIVSRFKGSEIAGCRAVRFEALTLPTGRWSDDKHAWTAARDLSGRVSRLVYTVPGQAGGQEVFQSYLSALKAGGFTLAFSCHGFEDCGYGFAEQLLGGVRDTLAKRPNLVSHVISAASGEGKFSFLTAFLDRPQGEVGVSLMVVDRDKGSGLSMPVVVLRVVERQQMASGQVTVDARAMSKGLAKDGHIALYGIQFATDSAQIEHDSQGTLAQMAKMLVAEPKAKVFIVGHTDNTGQLAHNLALSKARAKAVVDALVTKYGIQPDRLMAEGVASFSPVASNASEAGRARNRRVEMVLQ